MQKVAYYVRLATAHNGPKKGRTTELQNPKEQKSTTTFKVSHTLLSQSEYNPWTAQYSKRENFTSPEVSNSFTKID